MDIFYLTFIFLSGLTLVSMVRHDSLSDGLLLNRSVVFINSERCSVEYNLSTNSGIWHRLEVIKRYDKAYLSLDKSSLLK